MAQTSLIDVRGGLPDPQDTGSFDFIIPSVPNGSSSDGRDLAVLCQQAVHPGRSNEILEAPLHGQQFNFSGRAVMPRTLSIVYVERSDMLVTNLFRGWFEFQRGTVSGTAGGYKADYAVDGALLIKYDVTGAVADQIVFYGLQPEELPDAQLDGTSTNLWTVNMSFRYDFYEPRNVPLL